LESCDGALCVVELGAALVSVLELSDAGGVKVVESGPTFVSFLLDCWGTGVPEEGPVPGVADVLGAFVVSTGAGGAGAFTVLVSSGSLSLIGASLLRLQPMKTSGSASIGTTRPNLEARKDRFIIGDFHMSRLVWVIAHTSITCLVIDLDDGGDAYPCCQRRRIRKCWC